MTELSYDKLKNASIEEIYEFLQEEYLDIYKSYNYIFKSSSEFLMVIKNIIKDIINNLPNKVSYNYKNYLLNQSKLKLNRYVKSMLDKETKIDILTSYINMNLNESQNELKKLIKWFQVIDYIPDPSIIIELVTNNQKLNNILARIVENNLERIKKYGLESIFKEELAFEFLDIYCSINNVIDNSTIYMEEQEKTYNASGANAFIKEIKGQKLYVLSKEEEKELFLKYNAGDEEAYNKILYHNLRLVLSVAGKYVNRGLDYEDLIQEGNIGLITAISRYDVTKGFRFSTYAIWWIRQALIRAIGNSSRNIRIPIHKMEKLNKFVSQVKELENKLGYPPSYVEIAKYLNLKYSIVEENFELLQTPTSLNTKIGEDEDIELEDFIPDSKHSNLEDDIINDNLAKEIEELFLKAGLTKIECDILQYRYGLNYSEEKILEEIGKIYGISRERVRQKESKAIIKLRKCPLTQEFALYLDNPTKAQQQLQKLRSWHYNHPKSSTVYNLDVSDVDTNIEITKKVKKPRQLKTIYDTIPNYSKEEVDAAITKLKEEDKRIFYLRNGEDLEHHQKKVKEKTANLDYLYGLVVEKIRNILKHHRSIKTIYECLFKYSKEEIDQGISMLNDNDKQIIFYRYGTDLEHPVTSALWDPKKYSKILYVIIFDKIKRNIAKLNKTEQKKERKRTMSKKNISIYEQFSNYSKEEIDAEIANLKDKDKKIFYLRNGDDLEHPKVSPEFTSSMQTRYYNIIGLMKKHLRAPKKYIKGTIFYQLYKLNPNFTKEEYIKAISLLSAKEKNIINSRYGTDLDKPIEYQARDFNYKSVRKVLIHIINILTENSEIMNLENTQDNEIVSNEVTIELREFYIRAIELLKSPVFMKILLNLSVKEAIILAIIILSYLENREINSKDIAILLNMDIFTFQNYYRQMLLLFKENINEFLNTTITNLDNHSSLTK